MHFRKISVAFIACAACHVQRPSLDFDQVSARWSDLTHLIILPGHAIQWCTEVGKPLDDPSCWYLFDYQREQVPLFLEHIKEAVTQLKKDSNALMVISDGQTRPGLGVLREATSYMAAAEAMNLFEETKGVYDRVVTEDYARDSYENVVFSVCRFQEITNRLPKKVTIVGFPFKEPRFTELHWPQLRLHDVEYQYISVEKEGFDQSLIVDDAYPPFEEDPLGCKPLLSEKRVTRNPYRRLHGYRENCPNLSHAMCPRSITI